MPEIIVETLEMIDIEYDAADGPIGPIGLQKSGFEGRLELASVGKPVSGSTMAMARNLSRRRKLPTAKPIFFASILR
jgi:hypothetical protein